MENLEKRLENIESFLPNSFTKGKEDNVCGETR